MQFNPADCKVIIETLSNDEAQDYIIFLALERQRHIYTIEEARRHILNAHSEACKLFWDSAIKRHQEDITGAEQTIAEVRERFKI